MEIHTRSDLETKGKLFYWQNTLHSSTGNFSDRKYERGAFCKSATLTNSESAQGPHYFVPSWKRLPLLRIQHFVLSLMPIPVFLFAQNTFFLPTPVLSLKDRGVSSDLLFFLYIKEPIWSPRFLSIIIRSSMTSPTRRVSVYVLGR